MKSIAVVILSLGLGACAHAPEPYSFTAAEAANDLDVIARVLASDGTIVAARPQMLPHPCRRPPIAAGPGARH